MGRIIYKLILSKLISQFWAIWLANSNISFNICQSKCSKFWQNHFSDDSVLRWAIGTNNSFHSTIEESTKFLWRSYQWLKIWKKWTLIIWINTAIFSCKAVLNLVKRVFCLSLYFWGQIIYKSNVTFYVNKDKLFEDR